ncbi:uncharacterized protein RJT21DRAFT_82029 [Scheffersomyces amazonensis]|uniref:uncharacterized protein n=1 Tax=Scheffersomyces amazonensis TaxID=1078765 RepID=UPI00315CD243
MLLKNIILITCLTLGVNSLVIKQSQFELTGAALKLTIQGLRDTKRRLESELKLLMDPLKNERSGSNEKQHPLSQNQDELLILAKDLLNSKIFQKIGFQKLVDDGYFYNFSIGKDLIHNNLLIPKESKNLFLFNTSDPLSIPKKLKNNFANFIDKSPPFSLPSYLSLIDYYLVIPKSYLEKHLDDYNQLDFNSIYSKTILKIETEKLPLFRKCINEGKPLLVFMFNGAASNEGLNTIMNIRNYLPINGQLTSFSTFFDTFAREWITAVNYESLIKSVFCTTNVESLDESYCLKIKDNKTLHVFPAFYDISKFITLKKREVETTEGSNTEVESQAIRQIHNRLSNVAHHVNDVTYELSNDPKPVFERLDERIDNKLDLAVDKIDEIPYKLKDKKNLLKGKLESKKDNLKDELDLTKMVLEIEHEHEELHKYANDPNNEYISKRSTFFQIEQDNLKHKHIEGGFVLPLSLIRLQERIITSPRSKRFSQVIFDIQDDPINDTKVNATQGSSLKRTFDKRDSIYSDDEDCQKITWYNIFHYSIFGKPKFCHNQ